MNIPFLPAHEIARQIKSGTLTALEVTEALLAHIEKVDGEPGSIQPSNLQPSTSPGVHAFITVTADRARAQAQAIDAKLAAGEDPGPLAGVPFTVKDIFCVEGTPSTAASRILANFTAPYTATPVERMEAAGAV
ncbi:MAG TPA: amidase family protein, partial [Anaerolineales bacterium]|nr:amidase family protein [Anaerolineales bacterium]